MHASLLLLATATLAVSLAPANADPKSDLADAIKKLSAEPNYSWTSTPVTEGSQSGRRQGPVEGKTEKDGITHLKLRTGDTAYELAFRGQKIIVKLSDDWVAPSELPVDDGRIEQRVKAFKTPDKEAAELLANAGSLEKSADGSSTGTLAPDAAKAIFVTLGRRAAEASEAKGNVKFWVKEGRLTKYEFKVQGKITVGTDKREVEISRTTTVEIKDVGTTKLNLPDDAKQRLS